MQHEREPLGGGERFEHHEQRETDQVGKQRLVLGVVLAALDRVGFTLSLGLIQGLLTP